MTVWRVVCAGLLTLLTAACGRPPDVAPPQKRDPGPAAAPAADQPEAAPPYAEEERLAAIEKAMNDLRDAAQQCWAAAATERFDIAGELAFQIEIAPGTARATAVRDTARNTKLAACLVRLLTAYRWAPPLHGQTIQLPFAFRAPDGQNTIDRALVGWNAQGTGPSRVSVAVLLDENNTGNDAASMVEIAIAAGGTTGLRRADRAELWYFLGNGEVVGPGTRHAVAAGDMMYVPKGGVREVVAIGFELPALIAMVPGGREGVARGGALPTREVANARDARGAPSPIVLPALRAKRFGAVAIFADAEVLRDRTLSASVVTVPAGTRLAEHVHAGETELLAVLTGDGTLTVNGVELPLRTSSVAQIPRNTRHTLAATHEIQALQIYTPAGPEQLAKARP